jgi:hypothetical protein
MTTDSEVTYGDHNIAGPPKLDDSLKIVKGAPGSNAADDSLAMGLLIGF